MTQEISINFLPVSPEGEDTFFEIHCPNCDHVYLQGRYAILSKEEGCTRFALIRQEDMRCSKCDMQGLFKPVLFSDKDEVESLRGTLFDDSEILESASVLNWMYLTVTVSKKVETCRMLDTSSNVALPN